MTENRGRFVGCFLLRFGDSRFTKNVEAFREGVGELTARGGGDDPESSLEAVAEACG